MSLTESPSPYDHLEKMPLADLLAAINEQDQSVPAAVRRAIPQLAPLIEGITARMRQGGRLFYLGAGTSGRLGVVDASECPPTFGVAHDRVIGLIAGGDGAIRKAVEFAEDDRTQAWQDMLPFGPGPLDSVVGIAASGRTPYVIGGIQAAAAAGLLTGCIVCNPDSALAQAAQYPVEILTGPELLTGSTRMKAGTAQKLALNMISTAVMIGLGHVRGNRMVDMQLTNHKLIERGQRMLMDELGISPDQAADLLQAHGSVRRAADAFRQSLS